MSKILHDTVFPFRYIHLTTTVRKHFTCILSFHHHPFIRDFFWIRTKQLKQQNSMSPSVFEVLLTTDIKFLKKCMVFYATPIILDWQGRLV